MYMDKNLLGVKIVLLSARSKMSMMWLPFTPQGRHFFVDSEEAVNKKIYIEARDNRWFACCEPGVVFVTGDTETDVVELFDKLLFQVRTKNFDGAIYIEFSADQNQKFQNYVAKKPTITIGRARENDIVYSNSYISRHHASIVRTDSGWTIRDENSVNYVYVNGMRVYEKDLKVGDVIYLLGLRILVGIGFLSINSGDERIQINDMALSATENTMTLASDLPKRTESANELFNRSPRRRLALVSDPIEVEGPPMSLNSNRIPMFLRMGSSMVMGGSAALMGNYTMLLTSVLFPFLTQRYTESEKKEYEERRIETYTDYLRDAKERIHQEKKYEEKVLNLNYPHLSKVVTYTSDKVQLWERRKSDDDFLVIRLGSGILPLKSKIDYPKKRFEMDSDELEDKLYQLVERNYYLDNVPIMTSIIENYVCGVIGKREQTLDFIQKQIMQLTILHSYDEVKTIFLLEADELKKLSFIKYLPHAWNDQRNIRFIATNNQEVYQISEYLKEEIESDLLSPKPREIQEILRERPYYVVFALSKKLFDSMEVLKEAMKNEKTCGVSIITVFDELPKECFQLVELNKDNCNILTYLKEIERDDDKFSVDEVSEDALISGAKLMANTDLKVMSQSYALPKTLSFLEMFGVGRVEHLNPLKRWEENNPIKSLATPIGVLADGSLFTLDLHQKSEGPHGLVAGMTGSGKSEFILTYILSMAVNYHPEEVAFILIDYKGGGLAGAFENPKQNVFLPHVVGSITNLDGAAIQRSLISIESELKRRQRVFNAAKNITNEGTMDIYLYQKLYRQKVVKEPVPHLFIISDEFAELKQQAPEFMEQLISTARIGRSLGVHLILATQKPSGVVNDQILSNTKFRVCLKVQDRADSMDMLKRPEAADLTDTGRFYLQVGYNEYFALGQSAWSGAPYEPQDYAASQKENVVRFVDNAGQTISEIKQEVQKQFTGKSQLVEIVHMLSDLAEQVGWKRKKLWCEPLPDTIDAKSMQYHYKKEDDTRIYTYLGMLDDPRNQRQMPAVFDLQEGGNTLIVGPSQSGKSTLLETLLWSVSERYTPEQLNYYVLDYSNSSLAELKMLPHCGVYLDDKEEAEVPSLIELIDEIVKERKELFAKLGVTSYRDAIMTEEIPLVLVVVDNIAGLNETSFGKEFMYRFQTYLKEGLNFGVKYVITANHSNEIPQRLKQEISGRIALCLKDRYEYMEVLPGICNYVPPIRRGKGLYSVDGELFELQAAKYGSELRGTKRSIYVKEELERIALRNSSYTPARGLTVVPETEKYDAFMEKFPKGRIPLGYNRKDAKPIALPLQQFSSLSLYFGNPKRVKQIMDNFMFALRREKLDTVVLKRERNSVFAEETGENGIEINSENMEPFAKELLKECTKRAGILRKYCDENHLDIKQEDICTKTFHHMRSNTVGKVVIIEDFALMCSQCDEGTEMIMNRLFEIAGKINVYFVGGFYPNENFSGSAMFRKFNREEILLLFGGKLSEQTLLPMNNEIQKLAVKVTEYNHFLMKYREGVYSMLMPCGELVEEQMDSDDVNIFE